MQIRGAVPQEAFAGELPQGVTCVGIPTSVGVLTAAFIDEAVGSGAEGKESYGFGCGKRVPLTCDWVIDGGGTRSVAYLSRAFAFSLAVVMVA